MKKRGVVNSFDTAKGYGWIQTPNSPRDTFVHFSQIVGQSTIRRNLCKGQRVEFVLVQTERGPAACDVRVVTKEE